MDKGRGIVYEMTLESLALFVGSEKCNAHCKHCAGRIHRKYAQKEDGIINEQLIRKTLEDCYKLGARYLSISSSGEPTLSPLSVTRVLEIVKSYSNKEMKYSPINLYSNGIRIGEDKDFSDYYLPLWKNLGLNWIYITVHDINEEKNAEIYRIKSYPSLGLIIGRIHNSGLLMRANLVLRKGIIDNFEKFVYTVERLKEIGADKISAWRIRGRDDKVDEKLSPEKGEMDKMEEWVNGKRDIRLLTEKYREVYSEGRKLTLFPNGTLSSSWCN